MAEDDGHTHVNHANIDIIVAELPFLPHCDFVCFQSEESQQLHNDWHDNYEQSEREETSTDEDSNDDTSENDDGGENKDDASGISDNKL